MKLLARVPAGWQIHTGVKLSTCCPSRKTVYRAQSTLLTVHEIGHAWCWEQKHEHCIPPDAIEYFFGIISDHRVVEGEACAWRFAVRALGRPLKLKEKQEIRRCYRSYLQAFHKSRKLNY